MQRHVGDVYISEKINTFCSIVSGLSEGRGVKRFIVGRLSSLENLERFLEKGFGLENFF